MEVTPRIVFVCDTCEMVFWQSEDIKVNSAAARPCIDAAHNVYASGVGRLEMATVRRYLAKQHHQPSLF